MIRLLISVEGKTEYNFVEQVLQPHFIQLGIIISLQNMKGNISIERIISKLNALIHNHDFVTTLYDFYGFKGKSGNETKASLENKIKDKIKDGQKHKIIPYIQMYEFETLLFSDAQKMANVLNTNQNWIDDILSQFNNLEEINNSQETAPSKRIEKQCLYIKTTHAPNILKQIGLAKIREKCAGFDAWITHLESLGIRL